MEVPYNDVRRLLVGLLAEPDDEPVAGLADVKPAERLFAIATCAARMIEESICAQTNYRRQLAHAGLERLMVDMHEHIDQLCNTRN